MSHTTLLHLVFGSHLYGTSTPSSDRDYKGVFLPSAQDILLGRIPRSIQLGTPSDPTRKNTPSDVDYESYSLHHFMKLAIDGDTTALDMLHAPRAAILSSSFAWTSLVANRHRFYTRNLKSLVGYARRQAAKYGTRGSRLSDAREVLNLMRAAVANDPEVKIGDLMLPELEHGGRRDGLEDRNGIPYYEICGKKMQETVAVRHYLPMMEAFVKNYGERAKMAEQNEGIDWKAMSHALRAGYQVRHILIERGFEYPLPETEYIVRVKMGEVGFREVSETLTDLIDEVEELSRNSTLPEKVDRGWCERWLSTTVLSCVYEELENEVEFLKFVSRGGPW